MDADLKLHREAAEWFVNLGEEPDDPALRQAFEGWLALDAAHAEAYRSVELTFGELGERQLPASIAMPPAVPAQRRGGARVWPAWRKRGRLRTAFAAAVAACMAIIVAPSLQIGLAADHRTGTGEIRETKLADGSIVRLGPDSAIAVDLAHGERTVQLLAGQAWFEVEHDAGRPFRVRAGNVTTTVLGTGFDVRRLGGDTVVSVAHGKVRVTDGETAVSKDLVAGQWVRIDEGRKVSTGAANPGLLGAWSDGMIVAKGLTVREVIDEIRPWYGGKIILTSTELGARKVSGIYDAKKPQQALLALINPDGGTVRQLTPWIIIVGEK